MRRCIYLSEKAEKVLKKIGIKKRGLSRFISDLIVGDVWVERKVEENERTEKYEVKRWNII